MCIRSSEGLVYSTVWLFLWRSKLHLLLIPFLCNHFSLLFQERQIGKQKLVISMLGYSGLSKV